MKRSYLKRRTPLKRKTPLSKFGKSDYKKAKKKAWDMFSKYIRTRDCLLTTGEPDVGLCITCGRRYQYKELQAGHFIPGRMNAYLFCDQGTHAQCVSCNIFGHGRPLEYRREMVKRRGEEWVKNYELLSKLRVSIPLSRLTVIYDFYKNEYEKLEGINEKKVV